MIREKYHHLFWDLYSDKMHKWIITHPHAGKCQGREFFHQKLEISYKIHLVYDEEKDIFTKMTYQVSGRTFMIALLEGLNEMVLNKKVSTIAHLRADDLLETLSAYEITDRYSDEDISDYVQYLSRYANHVIDSYIQIMEDIVPIKYTTPEGLHHFTVENEGIANFFDLEKPAQISHLERVLENDIRPYVQLDDGNVKIKDMTKNGVVFIVYEGNCTSCHASGSTTLSAITNILKAKVHEKLEVLPFLGS